MSTRKTLSFLEFACRKSQCATLDLAKLPFWRDGN